MKNFSLFIFLCCASWLSAQPEPLPQDPYTLPNFADSAAQSQLAARHLTYFTQTLAIPNQDVKAFWKIFRAFQIELQAVRPANIVKKNIDTVSDAEAEEILKGELDKQAKELKIRKKYVKKLLKVIPAKKIAKLHRTERDFRQMILKELGR